MKNTWAGDGVLEGMRSGNKGVTEVKACRNSAAGSILSRRDGQGIDSVVGDRKENTEVKDYGGRKRIWTRTESMR